MKRWVQAGGKVMGGTDDPFPGATGFNQHMEMAMLVEVGLTPMQALRAMTIWGAEVMTARRKAPTQPPVGFIGPGAFADIVVLGANPLDNIDNTRTIERVMKGGRFVRLGYTVRLYKAPGRRSGRSPRRRSRKSAGSRRTPLPREVRHLK